MSTQKTIPVNRVHHAIVAGIMALSILLLTISTVQAAPKAKLWERWTAHDATSTQIIDHGYFNEFLMRYVRINHDNKGVNVVDYKNISAEDNKALDVYLDTLQTIVISDYTRDEQQAFWINLYNAKTIDVILDHYPVKSIRDIDLNPSLFASGPWSQKIMTIENEQISLDDIEHRILRPIWQDARIHYVLTCASMGCPHLQAKAAHADDLELHLNRGAAQFINHPRAVMIDADDTLTLSTLYKWYRVDFGTSDVAFIKHLQKFADEGLKENLNTVDLDTADYQYDWALNQAP